MLSKLISFSTISVLLLSACSGEEETVFVNEKPISLDPLEEDGASISLKQEAFIDRPFEGLDVPFKMFNYDPKRTNVYEIASGTRIEIPKSAFVDETGRTVEKKISIAYREMHDLEDIMISGIKMNYEQEDTSGDFESAGMFEIRAKRGEEELKLKKGKEIQVDFASYRSGDFKSYSMNESTANWEYIEDQTAIPNRRKQERIDAAEQRLDELEFICRIQPREMRKSDEPFDLNYDLDDHPEFELFHSALWIIGGGSDKKEEFRQMSSKFEDLKIAESDSCNFFELTFIGKAGPDGNREEKQFLGQPVWSGKAYRKVKKNHRQKVKEYEKLRKKMEREKETATREADLVRKFQVKGMGIFNCDRIMNFVKFSAAALVLTCREKIQNFFLITLKRRASIKFYDPTVSNFKYDPDGMNSIIAILPNNKIGTVSEEAFGEAVEKLRNKETDKLQLELQIQDQPIETKEELKNHIPRPRF